MTLFTPSLFFTFWYTKKLADFSIYRIHETFNSVDKKTVKVCKTVCYTELFFIDLMLLLLSSYYTLCCKQMLVWVFFTKNNSGLRGTCKLVLHAPAVDLESFTSTQEIKKLYSRPKSYIPSTIYGELICSVNLYIFPGSNLIISC